MPFAYGCKCLLFSTGCRMTAGVGGGLLLTETTHHIHVAATYYAQYYV